MQDSGTNIIGRVIRGCGLASLLFALAMYVQIMRGVDLALGAGVAFLLAGILLLGFGQMLVAASREK